MLKDAIRSLVGNTEKITMVLGGQLQLAGVSAAEHNAIKATLHKNKEEKMGYWV